MSSVAAIEAAEVPAGSVREVMISGRSIAVCNTGEAYYAVSGDCPHRNGPLGHGALHQFTLVCPWHLWEFDIRTGECAGAPDCTIATYPVSVQDGVVCIEVPYA